MSYLKNYYESTKEEKRSPYATAYFAGLDLISDVIPEVAETIEKELKDQRSYIKLIASENYSSPAVQMAMGNFLTDKYAEGYEGHRFYAGCENVDTLEAIAVNELKELFGAEAAYVQPHSGADANLVAFFAILTERVQKKELEKRGKKTLDELNLEELEELRQLFINQKLLGLSLNSGGHLTHGYRHNSSGKLMKAVAYEVNKETGLLDYDEIERIAKKEKPLILLAGYSSYPRKINFKRMKEIADSVGAVLMVDMAHFSGLVAGKVFTEEYNPVPFADIVTSTTHKTLRGPRGGFVLCKKEFEEAVNKGCPYVLGGPLPHVIAAKAVAFKEALNPSFQKYAHKIVENSQGLAKALEKHGLKILTGGTDNHLCVIDISSFGINGRQAENALRLGHLTVNRNAIPFDPNGAWYTSGLRIGTPAVTTLGMGVKEMEEIANIIFLILSNTKPAPIISKEGENKGLSRINVEIPDEILYEAKGRVLKLLEKFPLYSELPCKFEALLR